MKIHVSSDSGGIELGILHFYWINKTSRHHGYVGFELARLNTDEYISIIVGSRWRIPVAYNFTLFGKHFIHHKFSDKKI